MSSKTEKMKIYTRTGDKGETSLYSGGRIWKDDPLVHAVGTVDECNCQLGVALSLLPEDEQFEEIRDELVHIQHALFDLGAAIATPRTRASAKRISNTRFDTHATQDLEKWIDMMDDKLDPLKTFILPGGHPAAAALHMARSICRRAERHCIPSNLHHDLSDNTMTYLNRLSDYLFILSRYVNHLTGNQETLWVHHVGDSE